jgi:hypothetical protein
MAADQSDTQGQQEYQRCSSRHSWLVAPARTSKNYLPFSSLMSGTSGWQAIANPRFETVNWATILPVFWESYQLSGVALNEMHNRLEYDLRHAYSALSQSAKFNWENKDWITWIVRFRRQGTKHSKCPCIHLIVECSFKSFRTVSHIKSELRRSLNGRGIRLSLEQRPLTRWNQCFESHCLLKKIDCRLSETVTNGPGSDQQAACSMSKGTISSGNVHFNAG